ncbi:serine/threonine-protein phosphatase [Streptomyces sp. RS10V-4]|uniref:PP2C family protein-serine/threonine phosphatase n=1 Tax=Streptomyces rhizoryzae TaxID=2932493 RepID=UPI0020051C82|nr:PP2C family protein-serine/threonine phosphatase [Streptomyces rhizoryzae]MCK7625285.1 serine/threonine-protein phosphatase [Streptomyces rhizoryzae]
MAPWDGAPDPERLGSSERRSRAVRSGAVRPPTGRAGTGAVGTGPEGNTDGGRRAGPDRGRRAAAPGLHTTAPTALPALVDRYAGSIGLRKVCLYVVDLQQRYLTPMAGGERLPVDSSLAGWTYRTLSLRVEQAGDPAAGPGQLIAWLPLVDGDDRLGVLGAHMDCLDSARLRRCRTLAAVLAMVITSRRAFSDQFVQQARTETMTLPAEMVRSLLPPRSIGNDRAVSTAVLEPAYELGGDGFDHSLTASSLNAVILDAMGHNLASGMTTSLALAGCRSARRRGGSLTDLVDAVDEVLAGWLPDQFCTGIATQLDLASGVFTWCNCGHPPPLLIRDQHVLDAALDTPGEPPMGMPARLAGTRRRVHQAGLEPGDRVLLYTDGVTEARMPDGTPLGLDGFTADIIRATAAGELAAEALRRLIHSLMEHQNDALRDDATILLIEWHPQH